MPQQPDERQEHAAGKPEEKPDPDLAKEDLPHVCQLDPPCREPSNNEGRGLQAHVPSHGRDDRNETDDGHHFLDGIAEIP